MVVTHPAYKGLDDVTTSSEFADLYERAMARIDQSAAAGDRYRATELPADPQETLALVADRHHVGAVVCYGGITDEQAVTFFANTSAAIRPQVDSLAKLIDFQEWLRHHGWHVTMRQLRDYFHGVRMSKRNMSLFVKKMGGKVV